MNGMTRFLSRRDKKTKTGSPKDAFRIFQCEDKRRSTKEEEKHIQVIAARLEELEITNVKESHIKYALQYPSAKGDPDKALELIRLYNETMNGKIVKYNPVIPLLGAENRNMVTCYIDSLLFAMFARLDSFESILSVPFQDPATNHLANMIRFWVNMLRTGKLITADIAKHIQEALADCGWEDAKLIRQQDVSEAFTFITDKLALPLLKLKMDVYHTGKESMDDHRIVQERLLDVAIPEEAPTDGTVVKLEDCLESFFNNKIEVTRLLQRRNTINSRPTRDQLLGEKGEASKVEEVELPEKGSHAKLPRSQTQESVFRRRKLDLLTPSANAPKEHKDDMNVSYGREERNNATVLRKEVMIPAWQFFHLIPWFQAKSEEGPPTTDAQVAAHFSTRRPVLGICLKRYKITKDGPKRLGTYIDIPLEIRLPHFVSNGTQDDGFGSSFSTFKLVLQSVICHRGSSLNAGHYISIVRPSPHEMKPSGDDVDTQYQWLMFDDLATKDKVTNVDVRKALEVECPYLVFYQVQPIEDDDNEGTDLSRSSSEPEEPPTYAEATLNSTPATNTAAQNSQTTITPHTSIADTPLIVAADREDSATPQARVAHLPPVNLSLLAPNSAASSPKIKPLEQIRSAPPAIDDQAVRPHSLDVPRSPAPDVLPQSRLSGESNKRSSVAFTESSFMPSAATTPAEDSNRRGSYIDAKDINSGTSSPTRKWLRGRAKENATTAAATDEDAKDGTMEKSEKRSSRANWLSVGSKRIRPKSMPPVENRTTMGDFMKGIRGAMSKDKLVNSDANSTRSRPDSPMTNVEEIPATNETTTPIKAGPVSAVPNGTPASKKEKEKDKSGSVKRRKSLRARSRGRNNQSATTEDGEGPERQCILM